MFSKEAIIKKNKKKNFLLKKQLNQSLSRRDAQHTIKNITIYFFHFPLHGLIEWKNQFRQFCPISKMAGLTTLLYNTLEETCRRRQKRFKKLVGSLSFFSHTPPTALYKSSPLTKCQKIWRWRTMLQVWRKKLGCKVCKRTTISGGEQTSPIFKYDKHTSPKNL